MPTASSPWRPAHLHENAPADAIGHPDMAPRCRSAAHDHSGHRRYRATRLPDGAERERFLLGLPFRCESVPHAMYFWFGTGPRAMALSIKVPSPERTPAIRAIPVHWIAIGREVCPLARNSMSKLTMRPIPRTIPAGRDCRRHRRVPQSGRHRGLPGSRRSAPRADRRMMREAARRTDAALAMAARVSSSAS